MGKIKNAKVYTGEDLDTVFFRPILFGTESKFDVRVMYNAPVPTSVYFWKRGDSTLRKYNTFGWSGSPAFKYQKYIQLSKVKAEVGYSAEDYFNMVYEQITNRSDVNLDDLSGTELETAETTLFKQAIAESIRATMWLGDTAREGQLNTFDGFLKHMHAVKTCNISHTSQETLKGLWDNASPLLKESKSQGNLAYFVTSDIYTKYDDELSFYTNLSSGNLAFRGIPVIDLHLSEYLPKCSNTPQSFAILADRRNLILAINTADFAESEVRMWYNPDRMENRQKAAFMAGCDFLTPELIALAK